LRASLARIAEEGAGVVVYLHQSGLGARKHYQPGDSHTPPQDETGIGAQIVERENGQLLHRARLRAAAAG